MNKFWKMLAATTVLAASAGAAQAGGHVNWSIGINLPPIGTVISNGPVYPVYAPAPVYAPPVVYQAAPVYRPVPVYAPVYRPAPVYYPEPVYYGPPARYYGPSAVVVDRRWAPAPRGHWERRDWDDQRRYRH